MGSIQWLDKENGQPGPNLELFVSNDPTASSFIDGGKHLLINKTTVLRISDLAVFHFDTYRENIDYSAANLVAFYPDQDAIVFLGNKYEGDKFIYALMVFNYKNNEAYAVPFDQTATRMQNEHDINSTWINTFFEWQTTNDANYVLVKKELPEPPFWQGRFSDKDSFYNLVPAKEEMRHVLADFVCKSLAVDQSAIQPHEAGDNIYLDIPYSNMQFSVGYWENLKNVHFTKSFDQTASEESLAIIKKIGNDFNEELKKGKYQEFFTTY